MEPLSDAMKSHRHGQVLSATAKLEAIRRILPRCATPRSLVGSTLTIEVATAADAFVIRQNLDEILDRIAGLPSVGTVETVSIRIAHLPYNDTPKP